MSTKSPNPEVVPGGEFPAIFSNRFWITIAGGNARLVFCEQLTDQHIPVRGVYALNREDAKQLGTLLLRVIAEVEANEKTGQAVPVSGKVH